MKKMLLMCLFAIFFVGCASSFKSFYNPWFNENYFPQEAYLKEGEEPVLMKTSDLDAKYREVTSRWYWCIGYSGFNGPNYSENAVYRSIANFSKEVKAKVVIWSKSYTDTRNGVFSSPQTHYHSYVDAYGMGHTYTTTSYSTYSYSIDRYDYSAYFFIPIPEKYRMQYAPGFTVANLSQKDRDMYKQNVGCKIITVFENSVAYYANVFYGDIITKINGRKIYTTADFVDIRNASNIGDTWKMTIIRNGKPYKISLRFGL